MTSEKQKNNSKSHHQSRAANAKIGWPYLRISTKHNPWPPFKSIQIQGSTREKANSKARPESWWIFRRLGRFAVGVVNFKRPLLANYTLKRTPQGWPGFARRRKPQQWTPKVQPCLQQPFSEPLQGVFSSVHSLSGTVTGLFDVAMRAV